MESCSIPSLSSLPIHHDENDIENKWVLLEDFLLFLRNQHRPTDKIKDIKKSNVQKEFKGHFNGLKEVDGHFRISVRSVLRYCFHHTEHLYICQKVVHQIEKKCFGKNTSSELTIKDIYVRVVKTFYRSEDIENHILQTLEIDDSQIDTLFNNYKDDFDNLEWKKICLFEHHFGKSNYYHDSDNYEKLVEQKSKFLDSLKEACEMQSFLLKSSKLSTVERIQRRKKSQCEEAVSVVGNKRHFPEVLDAQLHNLIPENFEIDKVISVDCTRTCKHPPALHLFVESGDLSEEQLSDICLLFDAHIRKKHNDNCAEIIFLRKGAFELYTDKFGRTVRFELRDNIMMKTLNEQIFHVWQVADTDFENDFSSSNCLSCYGISTIEPLDWTSFDILKEWTMGVPVIGQIILESYINKESLRKSENVGQFLNIKLRKLYSLFDSLLNLTNKNYIGLLQDVNSQELAMNYQSINTVFSVTSFSGATLSLHESEQRMKEKANSDFCYFNTYLRKYEMLYETAAGMEKVKVSLRDCIIIVMMDNLVRLKYHKDPEPGESRSMQICTLPITIKGIPKDAKEIEKWHDHTICDGTNTCKCKEDLQLQKTDFENEVLCLNAEEKSVLTRCHQLFTWGFPTLWTEVFEKGIWNTIPVQMQEEIQEPENHDLEVSFSTLRVNDPASGHEQELEVSFSHLAVVDSPGSPVLTPCTSEEDVNKTIDYYNQVDDDEEGRENELEEIFDGIDIELEALDTDLEIDRTDIPDFQNMSLDDSFDITPIVYDEEDDKQDHILRTLGFEKFTPPMMLTRHPPPATGRDDDIGKLRQILDDILVKTDHASNLHNHEKILCGPDNKIGSNLIKLREQNKQYEHFLPEFPLLHLRKSKINNLCSAYQHAGLIHILKYMRDDDVKDWKKLINSDHIDKATKYIRRLSLSLHLAFICSFMQTLSLQEAEAFQKDILANNAVGSKWELQLEEFMEKGKSRNGTFALHADMMKHCDEISAIALSERLGGRNGYHLLLAAVKSSLPFSFLNGASSYAAYCTKLIHAHLKCGPFYKNMKMALFTTPHKGSNTNFALDAQREMDHQDVIKAFRSGATMESVIPRMSLIDSLNDVHRSITERDNTHKEKEKSLPDILGITLNSTDLVYILRITGLILRRGGISTIPNKNVYNMYEAKPDNLPDSILDQHSKEAGEFLIKKYVANNNLFAFDKTDIPDLSSITGPKTLVQKLKQSKGVTIRRIPLKRQQTAKTEREIKEDKRNKEVAKQSKQINHISSQMNLCQSIVKPDCSKPKVQKSQGIQKALLSILIQTYTNMEQQHLDEDNGKDKLESDGAVILGSKVIPPSLATSSTYATLEFAGIKFSSFAHTGNEYLNYIGKDVIGKIKHQLPLLKHLAICEEKYNFTPDDFKAATRAQRKTNQKQSISHLKTADEVLSADKFDKTSLISTTEGKVITSTYLAKNISQLDLKQTITLDIDSELQMTPCNCEKRKCTCTRFCTPIQAVFKEVGGYQGHELLDSIRQNKGEAEMSQVDWLIEYSNSLKPKESCVSIVSSGDIDAVVVHLFAVSHLWPRTENGKFKNEVYVILRKPNQIYDIYNITKIILMIENFTSEKFIGMKIAIILSLGGNDFLPKFYQISHSLTVDLFMREATFREGLVTINTEEGKVVSVNFDADHYTEFIKYLYCPKLYDASKLTYEEVRQMSIKMPTLRSKGVQRNAQLWMPPKSVVQTLAKNVDCLIKYYLSAGLHFAPMPEFLVEGCLLKLQSGEIEYNFGPESFAKDIKGELSFPENELLQTMNSAKKKVPKRKILRTPQKSKKWKLKPQASTPKKS